MKNYMLNIVDKKNAAARMAVSEFGGKSKGLSCLERT